jgi:hypothetical protein
MFSGRGLDMPLWSLDIEKERLGEFWTNRYILNAADLTSAVSVGLTVVNNERSIHKPSVIFTRYRVSDFDPLTDIYSIVSVSLPGLAPSDPAGALPLFNVVRVDFNTAVGRPSRKYLRTPIGEGEHDSGNLTAAYASFIHINYTNPMLGITEFVDVDGDAFTSGATFSVVAMRQLRRGSRRRTEPILPPA